MLTINVRLALTKGEQSGWEDDEITRENNHQGVILTIDFYCFSSHCSASIQYYSYTAHTHFDLHMTLKHILNDKSLL